MRLVADTSVLVGELLRRRGRERLGDERLELFLAEPMWDEVRVELPRRIARFAKRRDLPADVAEELTMLCLESIEANVAVGETAVLAALEIEARARSRRDPADWPTVACARALDAGIWTNDNDFLGTGVATWTTETLQGWLDTQPLD
jgi:predicted nucleic acid-binding protein